MAKKAKNEDANAGREPDGKFSKGNKLSVGNKGGQSPMYSDPEKLDQKIQEYFTWCKGEYIIKEGQRFTKSKLPDGTVNEITETYEYEHCVRDPETPSVTGLAYFLGFESRQSMYDYQKKADFAYIIKRGIIQIEKRYESGLWNDRPTGAIFALKNMGWTDRTETDITTKGQSINNMIDASKLSDDTLDDLILAMQQNEDK